MDKKNIEDIDFQALTSDEAAELGLNVVFREDDGTYDWIYCMNMFQNKSMLFMFLKIFGLTFAIFGVIALYLSSDLKGLLWTLGILVMLYGLVVVIVIFSLWLVHFLYRGDYLLVYQMNDDGIMFSQTADQAQMTSMLASASSAASAADGNVGGVIAGSGMAMRANGYYSKFSEVKSVKGRRKYSLIWVNTFLQYQMVYVPTDAYDFVWDYITKRSVNARISEK